MSQQTVPRHVAIIMDGNGRWAKERGLPRREGHRAGAESVRECVETCEQLGVEFLTLYAFSSENWNRPQQEVSGLMNILKSYLVSELGRMEKNQIRLHCIGDISRLPDGVRQTLQESISRTSANDKMVLNLALSYGARDEICMAVRALVRSCAQGTTRPEQIDPQLLADHLYTAGQPDPDLLIRTGGEQRLSNFLLWQASYAEIYFTETMWPDFRKPAYLKALADFQRRERRFGKIPEQLREAES
jgi:undecaprenyl diphosphate synthase